MAKPQRSPLAIIQDLCNADICKLRQHDETDHPSTAKTKGKLLSLDRYIITYTGNMHQFWRDNIMQEGEDPCTPQLEFAGQQAQPDWQGDNAPVSQKYKQLLGNFSDLLPPEQEMAYEALLSIKDGEKKPEDLKETLARLPRILEFAVALEETDKRRINIEQDYLIELKKADNIAQEPHELEQSINDDRAKALSSRTDNIRVIKTTIRPLVNELMQSLGIEPDIQERFK